MLGIGELIVNDNFVLFYTISNQYILSLARLFILAGKFVIANFPLLVVLKLVSKKTHSSFTIIMGLAGYVIFLITTMLIAPEGLPATSFSSIFGISYTAVNTATGVLTNRFPIQTGMIGAFVVAFCTHMAYLHSRGKHNYGFLGFVDRNTYGVILNIIYCTIAGAIVSLGWEYFNNYSQDVINFIAGDITNPMNMFTYGIMDRMSSVFYVGASIREPFWYTALGGSWNSLTGEAVQGDVTIWSQVIQSGSSALSYGRFITPYYVLNIFAIPGMLVGLFTLYTDRIQRSRLVVFLLLIMLASALTGTLLPLELFLLFLAPLLLVFHIIYTGILFGIFEYLGIYLGFSYSGDVVTALPGKAIDYIFLLRNADYLSTLRTIMIVGLMSFVIYLLVTRIYFKYLAFDMFDLGKKKALANGFAEAIGGIENIKMINASPYRLIIQLSDTENIDLVKIRKLGATKVSRTRAGLAFSFGASSIMIKRLLDKQIAATKRKID